jgi:hypothetical protein
VPPPWPCESWEVTKGKVSNLRGWSVVAGPTGLGPEIGEGQQRLCAVDPSACVGGALHRQAHDCLTLVEVGS